MSGLISVSYSAAAFGPDGVLQPIADAMPVGIATARHIRRRVLEEGVTATPAKPYKATPEQGDSGKRPRRSYVISPAYQSATGAPKRYYKSSADFHAAVGARPGSFSVTGAMWRGLQVRNWGNEGVVIDFGGSSLGASSAKTAKTVRKTGTFEVTLASDGKVRAKQVRELRRDAEGKVSYRAKPKLVRNSQKAGAVFSHSKVGLLQPTTAEMAAQLAAVAFRSGTLVQRAFDNTKAEHYDLAGRNFEFTFDGDQKLLVAILREFR